MSSSATSATNPSSSSRHYSVMHLISHRFVIDDFSWFYANRVDEPDTDQPYIRSKTICPSENPDLTFELRLYPKGDTLDCIDHLSVYVEYTSRIKNKIHADFSFSILNPKGEIFLSISKFIFSPFIYMRVCTRSTFIKLCIYRFLFSLESGKQIFDESIKSLGYEKFATGAEVLDPANDLLPNDQLTICFEVCTTVILCICFFN